MKLLAKTSALASFFLKERSAPPKWLFRTHTQFFERFIRDHDLRIERDEAFTYLWVDGTPFVWPAGADVERLQHLVSELIMAGHPHQYDCGLTKVSSTDVILDVGACEGAFAALAVQRGARVIAVEPSPTMHQVIERRFVLRRLNLPHIAPCLLGATNHLAYFKDNPVDPARSQIADEDVSGSIKIQVRTIDELVEELPAKPTYIKCDAEGADYDLLLGGRDYLRHARLELP